jgi:hypothetical protein
VMSEGTHHLELILGHCPKRVVRVPFTALGLGRVAVPAQVGQDEAELFREAARNLVPDDMGLGIAVQQEQWRARTPRRVRIVAPVVDTSSSRKPGNKRESLIADVLSDVGFLRCRLGQDGRCISAGSTQRHVRESAGS